MTPKTKAEMSTSSRGNLMLIAIFHHIILFIGDSVLLVGFQILDEVLGFFGVDEKFVECRYNEDFILYGRHEF